MTYAKNTSVPVERTKVEIESLIKKHGAESFSTGWKGLSAVVAFRMDNRFVKFTLPLPAENSLPRERYAQVHRQRWRALLLVLKAKLEAVETGISDFETEFLGNVMVQNGQTVADVMKPALAEVYESGRPLALPSGF